MSEESVLIVNIRGGITIGKGSVVGAGSVVTRVSSEVSPLKLNYLLTITCLSVGCSTIHSCRRESRQGYSGNISEWRRHVRIWVPVL